MPADTFPSGRRVIVTGAAGGIGRAVVGALAGSGCSVAACDVPGAPVGEVAGAAVWLISDQASYVTGAAWPVDGALTVI